MLALLLRLEKGGELDAFLDDFVGTNYQEKSFYNSPVTLPREGKYCDQRLMDEEGEQKERKR